MNRTHITHAALALALLIPLAGCNPVDDKSADEAACTYQWKPSPHKGNGPAPVEKGKILVKVTSSPSARTVAFLGKIVYSNGKPPVWIGKESRTETSPTEWAARTPYSVYVTYRANSPFQVHVDVQQVEQTKWVRCTILNVKDN